MDNLEEVGRFLDKFNLPSLKQDKIEILNKPITSTENEVVVKKSLKKTEVQDQMSSQETSIKHLEKSYCLSF